MASGKDSHLGDPTLLGKMDKLREIGISEYIQLPQLVVVGDQSSGKSSALEGLTDLPFPRDSTLCTRFATQIVFRRAEQESIKVSIVSSSSADAAREAKMKAFENDGLKTLSPDGFKSLLAEACDAMGIPPPGCPRADGQPNFSDDTFRIEVSGPKESHLSVIDVPGIFRTAEEGVTTEDDKVLVKNMVRRYIENPRTIILAVLAANVDIATTEILDMAAEVDPSGQRTLGILTKPDLVDKGAEQDIIDLIKGRKKKLKLGYCVVRNRGKQERNLSSAERNQAESTFFNAGPWQSLDRSRVGISALFSRLRDLLSRITRQEFPSVVRDISGRITACEEELEDLGPTRQTPEQQRKYLLGIAARFQEVVTFAVEAQYGRHQFLKDDESLRLATRVVELNSDFSEKLEKKGHAVKFSETIHTTSKSSRKPKSVRSRKLKIQGRGSTLSGEGKPGVGQVDRSTPIDALEYPELMNILPAISTPRPPLSESILVWIEREYKSARGFELGTFNPSILPTLFQELSRKWKYIAETYAKDIIVTVHHFCRILLVRLCAEERVQIALWSLLLDAILRRYRTMIEHVQFLMRTERSGNLLTTNHYFSETLDKLRSERCVEPTESFSLGLNDALPSTPSNNLEHTVKDIHDILKSYYKVARKRFADNVCMQGTDYHLITGPDTPLRVLSPQFVVELSDEQLEAVAGEDMTSVQQRKSLEKEIESLIKGRKILTA